VTWSKIQIRDILAIVSVRAVDFADSEGTVRQVRRNDAAVSFSPARKPGEVKTGKETQSWHATQFSIFP
jgi:hypothetical protein